MAHKPTLAFVINDRDYVLAECSDDGFNEPFAIVSIHKENAFELLRDAISKNDYAPGTNCIVFVPYEDLVFQKVRRKDLEDRTVEEVFTSNLDHPLDELAIDYGIANKAGRYTPVDVTKEALADAADQAKALGLTPIGLSTVFPEALRSPQPFFKIGQDDVAGFSLLDSVKRVAVAAVMAGLLVGAALAANYFGAKMQSGHDGVADSAALTQPVDPSLYPMLRPPPGLRLASVPEIEAPASPGVTAAFVVPKFDLPELPGDLAAVDLGAPNLPAPPETENQEPVDELAVMILDELEAESAEPAAEPLPIYAPDPELVRPKVRPEAYNRQMAARIPSDPALAPPTALLTTSIPVRRPSGVGVNVPSGASAAVVATVTPTAESAEDAATVRGRTLSKNNLSLIGVFGKANNREAMFRTRSGRFVTRSLGESINTWKIVAIGADQVRLSKGNKTETLRLP